MGIGILFSELILRLRVKDPSKRSEDRLIYWFVGMLGGLIPDLDVIPALLINVHSYTFHHFFTHTLLALGIAIAVWFILRKRKWSLPLLAGFGAHLLVDWIDNSISPLGPFIPYIESGLFTPIGILPGLSWTSEYWKNPIYMFHDLWTLMYNLGWGIPIGMEFLSFYDLIIIAITFALFGFFVYLLIKRIRRARSAEKT